MVKSIETRSKSNIRMSAALNWLIAQMIAGMLEQHGILTPSKASTRNHQRSPSAHTCPPRLPLSHRQSSKVRPRTIAVVWVARSSVHASHGARFAVIHPDQCTTRGPTLEHAIVDFAPGWDMSIVPGAAFDGVHDVARAPFHALERVAAVELVVLAFVGIGGSVAGEQGDGCEDDGSGLHGDDW